MPSCKDLRHKSSSKVLKPQNKGDKKYTQFQEQKGYDNLLHLYSPKFEQ
jgi:hypothetical protein